MKAATAPFCSCGQLICAAAVAWAAFASPVRAFPLIEEAPSGATPKGTELAAPDARDLRQQLQLANGLASGGPGWTILPRLEFQQLLTDNVLQQNSPRRWDLISYVSPGISISGETQRISMRFDYSPTLAMYARTASQNALSHQLNGIASITVVPNLAFVDVRAVAGVQNRNGALGGQGTGLGGTTGNINAATLTGATGPTIGQNRSNLVQTTSLGISPYLQNKFGDYGTGRLGYSVNASRYANTSGFTSVPFPTGGSGITQFTTEQVANFVSGQFLGAFQDTIDVQLSQTTSNSDGTLNTGFGGATTSSRTPLKSTSSRQLITNRLAYAINYDLSVFATVGQQKISYSNGLGRQVDGLTWNVGATFLPNPDSKVTVSYGKREGALSFAADAHYAISPSTSFSLAYNEALGTQLENVNRQLNAAQINGSGALVSGATNNAAFATTNNGFVQPGVFTFKTLSVSAQTNLSRDLLSLAFVSSVQTATGAGAGTSSDTNTLTARWTHQLQPDTTWSSSASYSMLQSSGGILAGGSQTLVASTGLQQAISSTLTGSLRYTFFKRSSANQQFSMYQNILILGLSKQF